MLTIKLAFRNITHAGLRTWLNVGVLSFAFVLIITVEGLYDGLSQQVKDDMINSEIGGGQLWQKAYDPYDPFSLEQAHAKIPAALEASVESGTASPVLITSAAIFPRGHIQSALLKGINPDQAVVNMPTRALEASAAAGNAIPGLIGSRMAAGTGLQIGDFVSVRWRNAHGTFDAADIEIVQIMNTNVQTIDKNQIWIPLATLQTMLQMPGEATIVTMSKTIGALPSGTSEWVVRDHGYLFKDIDNIIRQKKVSASFVFILLMGMALLAVFDTQVLSIFRRRREMGTLMALGMTRWSVIALFTFEGCLLGILALIVGSIYGIPLMTYLATTGITLPQMSKQVGFAIGSTFYPKYGLQLYVATSLILFIAVIIVSFLPTRRITKLKPTDALRGKLS
jgi:putative ABC transport system permease protein